MSDRDQLVSVTFTVSEWEALRACVRDRNEGQDKDLDSVALKLDRAYDPDAEPKGYHALSRAERDEHIANFFKGTGPDGRLDQGELSKLIEIDCATFASTLRGRLKDEASGVELLATYGVLILRNGRLQLPFNYHWLDGAGLLWDEVSEVEGALPLFPSVLVHGRKGFDLVHGLDDPDAVLAVMQKLRQEGG